MNELHMFDDYEKFYHRVENSQIFTQYCEVVYGIDFSQDGFADLEQIKNTMIWLSMYNVCFMSLSTKLLPLIIFGYP